MGVRHRCSKCRARQTFKRHWLDYKREKKCVSCGHTRFSVDAYRQSKRENKKKVLCRCDGYHYVHQRGSLHCIHSKMPLEEYEKYHAREGKKSYSAEEDDIPFPDISAQSENKPVPEDFLF